MKAFYTFFLFISLVFNVASQTRIADCLNNIKKINFDNKRVVVDKEIYCDSINWKTLSVARKVKKNKACFKVGVKNNEISTIRLMINGEESFILEVYKVDSQVVLVPVVVYKDINLINGHKRVYIFINDTTIEGISMERPRIEGGGELGDFNGSIALFKLDDRLRPSNWVQYNKSVAINIYKNFYDGNRYTTVSSGVFNALKIDVNLSIEDNMNTGYENVSINNYDINDIYFYMYCGFEYVPEGLEPVGLEW